MNAMTRRRTEALIRRGQAHVQPAMTLHRLLLSGLVALGMTGATVATATAQPFTGTSTGSAVGQAYALAARISGFHRWTGSTPPPASYCPTMRAGEAIMVELARLANRAIRYHQPGLALELQRAGDRLGDELDEEEAINDQAGIPYNGYPCLVVQSSYPSRAVVLALIERRVPLCRRKADAARASFDARRALMYQCLRVAGP
jgi:hypothetical protein